VIDRRQAVLGLAAVAGAALAPRVGAQTPPKSAAPAFELPPLPYPYDALEPHIDAETMRLHHGKHHATYVSKLNEAVAAEPSLAAKSVESLLADLAALPEAVRTAVRNHGGGHSNHTLFWRSMAPAKGAKPAPPAKGELATAIANAFGSHESLVEQFTKSAGALFGSGWVWLVAGTDGKLALESTPNQDSPLSEGRLPLVGLDLWEHAYYLKYQNRRAEYVQAWWQVVDWVAIESRLRAARG
jgi:Fe-Mn family superoxide dismutase